MPPGTATLYQLQQPEKLQTVLEKEQSEDCLSCRLTGKYTLVTGLKTSSDRPVRSDCLYRSGGIQLLLREASSPTTTSGNSQKRVKVRPQITSGRDYWDCDGFYGHGTVAFGELRPKDMTVWPEADLSINGSFQRTVLSRFPVMVPLRRQPLTHRQSTVPSCLAKQKTPGQ